MAPTTDEATKALELLPIGLSESEVDSDKAPNLESLKSSSSALRKLNHLGCHVNGMGDLEEVAPHTIQLEGAINEWTTEMSAMRRRQRPSRKVLQVRLWQQPTEHCSPCEQDWKIKMPTGMKSRMPHSMICTALKATGLLSCL